MFPCQVSRLQSSREIHPITGEGQYVFPSARTKLRPLSDNALLAAPRRMGYQQGTLTVHGFRSTASTLLNERGKNRDWIERQLAHGERDGVRAAYHYAEYLPERRNMMQEWADYLGELQAGAKVIPDSRSRVVSAWQDRWNEKWPSFHRRNIMSFCVCQSCSLNRNSFVSR